MHLNDIGKKPTAKFRKINRYLEENHGFTISTKLGEDDLQQAFIKVHEEITQLKLQGDTSLRSPEISKRLLVLEGLKTLKEDQMRRSPVFQSVVRNMVDYVVDAVQMESTGQDDYNFCFDEAMRNAMKEYRSSRYRFGDSVVEAEVRKEAAHQLANAIAGTQQNEMFEGNSMKLDNIREAGPWDNQGKRAGATGGHAATMPDTDKARHAMKKLSPEKELSLAPKDGENDTPMKRHPTTGKMMVDPFAAKAKGMKAGTWESATESMKESANLVKRLRYLLETEVSQAEVMMAAKGFAQELQEMVEKIGRLQNEDLPPVTDQMRETYGTESASAFQSQIYAALQGVMDALYTAKNQVDTAVDNMATTGQVGATVDMDVDVGMDDGMDPGMDAGMDDAGLGLDDLAGDLEGGDEMGDEFGGAEGEEPLGRAQKESIELRKRVLEMRKLVEKARKLKENRK